jgi:hypothetical protein
MLLNLPSSKLAFLQGRANASRVTAQVGLLLSVQWLRVTQEIEQQVYPKKIRSARREAFASYIKSPILKEVEIARKKAIDFLNRLIGHAVHVSVTE